MKTTWVIASTLLAASALTPAVRAQSGRTRTITTISNSSSYLGIGVQDIDEERAKSLKLKETRGTEVTKVLDDSPAAKAGIKVGDVVTEYNGQVVDGQEQLTRLIRETPVGRQVKVVVWRNGASQTLTATTEAAKSIVFDGGTWIQPEIRVPEITIPPIPQIDIPNLYMTYQNPALGIIGESLSQQEQLADFFGVKDGVLVKSVTSNSAAEKAGIKAGDVIIKLDDSKVSTTREITSALRSLRTKKTITVTVVRNKKEIPLSVTIETAATSRAIRAGMVLSPGFSLRLSPLVLRPRIVRLQPRLELLTNDRVI